MNQVKGIVFLLFMLLAATTNSTVADFQLAPSSTATKYANHIAPYLGDRTNNLLPAFIEILLRRRSNSALICCCSSLVLPFQ